VCNTLQGVSEHAQSSTFWIAIFQRIGGKHYQPQFYFAGLRSISKMFPEAKRLNRDDAVKQTHTIAFQ
jgi:hypothetical protein